jgi:hypothetical protein
MMTMTSPFPVSSVRRKAAFLLILAGALSARGQTGAAADKAPAADPKPLRECHVWRLDYGDDELGVVSGKACIDWEGRSVLVQLVSPVDGTRSLLTADRFSPADAQGQMEFVLTGLSPNLQKVVAPATAGLPNLHGGQGVQINAKSGDSHFAAATRFGDSADSTVTVSLSAAADNTLNGSWHYRADPVTERNLDGVGRVGAFAMPSGDQAVFLGMQTGWEEWTPLPPRIFYVEVLDDQTGQHFGPICPYPASTNAARTLMIVGQNLPILEGTLRQGGVPIPSPGGGAQRCLEPIKTDRTDFSYEDATLYQDPAMGLVQAKPNDQVERAWQRITEGMDDATAKAVRQMQVATVGVHINRGVMPGVTNFTWNGASGTWRLEFGDNTVQVRAMRPLPSGGKWEATPVAFVPEQVAAEVETAQVLPLDSIKVYVDTNGKFLDNPLVAARVGGSSSRLYRTPLIAIGASSAGVGGQAAVVIPAQPGDKIVFVADQKEGCFYGAAQADVSVYKNPEELSMSWNHALTVCAGLDKKEDILDWSHLPGQQAEALTNYFVFNLSADNCNIQLGQHAGMLMLRDLFIDLMKSQLASLKDTEADDDAVLGFGKSVAQVLKQSPQSLFAGLPVGDLNGQASTMSAAVDDTYIDGVFGKDEHAKRTWRASAFRTALNAYMQSIQGSIDEANGVKDTQFKELLKLTGHGFDAVLAQLNPRLMRRNPDSGQWEPDMIARGYIDSIAFKEKQFEDASEAAKLDTELVVGVVSAVVALPVMLSESAVASFVTWAGNGIIWGVQSADEVYQVYEVKREIGFAAGASVVLGEMRYDEAKTLDTEWWKVAGTIVAQGALANLQGVDALSKYNRELSVVRGLKILEELDGGVSALRKLPKGQLGDIQAAAIKAKALSVAGKELEPGLKQALSTWDAFANELKAGEPALAADLKKAAELKSALLPQDQAAVLTPGAAAAEAGPAAAEAAKLAAARRASVAASIKDLGTETAQLKVAETAAVEGPARKLISGQIKANDARAKIMNDMLEARPARCERPAKVLRRGAGLDHRGPEGGERGEDGGPSRQEQQRLDRPQVRLRARQRQRVRHAPIRHVEEAQGRQDARRGHRRGEDGDGGDPED